MSYQVLAIVGLFLRLFFRYRTDHMKLKLSHSYITFNVKLIAWGVYLSNVKIYNMRDEHNNDGHVGIECIVRKDPHLGYIYLTINTIV